MSLIEVLAVLVAAQAFTGMGAFFMWAIMRPGKTMKPRDGGEVMIPDWVKKLPIADQHRLMRRQQELVGRMMAEQRRSPAPLDTKTALDLAIARAALEDE